jgi:ribosomal protein L11 methylase PrmA
VYVSSTGADGDACGTEASPCASLAYAVPKLTSPSDQVIISGIINGRERIIKQALLHKSLKRIWKFSERKQNLY